MSIEIVLRTKTGTREQLRQLLTEAGFKASSHIAEWPEGTLHFHWFDHEDYRSFDGVEASIFRPRASSESASPKDGGWALHTRTRVSASPTDRSRQNQIVRIARQRFGGTFVNDHYGANRYNPPEAEVRDAVARGIYIAYEFVRHNLSAVKYALPDPTEDLEKLVGTKLEPLAAADPVRVLYNALVPFAVATLEHFFGQCFQILLRYEPRAKERLQEQTRKVDLVDVLAIQSGSKTIEDIIADWYSFQSLESIHKAYSEWFGIDLWRLLRRRKKVGDRVPLLESRLQELIQFRHGIVHRLSVDTSFRKQDAQETLDLVLAVVDTFVDYLETKGRKIRD